MLRIALLAHTLVNDYIQNVWLHCGKGKLHINIKKGLKYILSITQAGFNPNKNHENKSYGRCS